MPNGIFEQCMFMFIVSILYYINQSKFRVEIQNPEEFLKASPQIWIGDWCTFSTKEPLSIGNVSGFSYNFECTMNREREYSRDVVDDLLPNVDILHMERKGGTHGIPLSILLF